MNDKDPLLDFRNFLFLIWRHLNLPAPTRRQYAIAQYLQYGPRRKIIMAFRGVGKSWITAAYVLWRLYCNPQVKILVVSASKNRSDNFTTFCLKLIEEVEVLRHLQPREDQRKSRLEFDVGPARPDQSPSVKSAGITGQITGTRADEIVADDVEVANNSDTQTKREKLSEVIKEFDAILKPDGRVTYLGTPQSEDTIYLALQTRGYECRIWPSEYPDEKLVEKYGNKLATDIVQDLQSRRFTIGCTTEPTRFSDIDLAERRASYGRAGYSLQFLLDTQLSDADRYPLKFRDLIVFPLNTEEAPERLVWGPTDRNLLSAESEFIDAMTGDRAYGPIPIEKLIYRPYTGKVMAIDPSGRGKDETSYAIVGCLNSMLYVLDVGGFTEGYTDGTLEALANVALKNGVNLIKVEPNFGDGMFTKLLTPVVLKTFAKAGKVCAVEEGERSSTQKEKRIIDTLEPVFGSHRLVVDPGVLERDYKSVETRPTDSDGYRHYRLSYQITRLTREKGALAHDDRIDALSIAVSHWVNHLAQDQDKAMQEQRLRDVSREIEAFRRGFLGGGQGSLSATRSWINRV